MATATLSTNSQNAGTNKVTINYNCSSGDSYDWSFWCGASGESASQEDSSSSRSGTVTFSGLDAGEAYWCTGSVIITTTTGSGDSATTKTETADKTINFWTRPEVFTEFGSFTPNGEIVITAQSTKDWRVQCNKFAHWKKQTSSNPAGSSCEGAAGNPITASWYNACCDAITSAGGTAPSKVTKDKTPLSASSIKALGTAVSP